MYDDGGGGGGGQYWPVGGFFLGEGWGRAGGGGDGRAGGGGQGAGGGGDGGGLLGVQGVHFWVPGVASASFLVSWPTVAGAEHTKTKITIMMKAIRGPE